MLTNMESCSGDQEEKLAEDNNNKLAEQYEENMNEMKKCYSSLKDSLQVMLKMVNLEEVRHIVDRYLMASYASDPRMDLLLHTRNQFDSLITARCPAASTELKLFIDEVDNAIPENSEWFIQKGLIIQNIIINPLQARLTHLENDPDHIMRILEAHQRGMLGIVQRFMDHLSTQSEYLKKHEEENNQINSTRLIFFKWNEQFRKLLNLFFEVQHEMTEHRKLRAASSSNEKINQSGTETEDILRKHRGYKAKMEEALILCNGMEQDMTENDDMVQLILKMGDEGWFACFQSFSLRLHRIMDLYSSVSVGAEPK